MQGLAATDQLKRMDYVSTVSGGGYSGIAATLAANASDGAFPFQDKHTFRDTSAMQTMRNNANYLKSGYWKEMLKNLAIVCKGVAANITITAAVLLFFAAFTLWANPTVGSLDIAGFAGLNLHLPKQLASSAFGVSIPVVAIGFIISICWAVYLGLIGKKEDFRGNFVVLSSVWLFLAALSVFFELQPVLVKQMISENDLKVISKFEACIRDTGYAPTQSAQDADKQEICLDAAQKAVKRATDETKRLKAKEKSENAPAPETNPDVSGFKRVLQVLQALLAPALAFAAFASRYVGDLLKTGAEEQGWGPTMKRLTGRAIVWAAGLALPFVLWAAYLGLVYWGVVITNAGVKSALFAPVFLREAADIPTLVGQSYAFASFYLFGSLVLLAIWILASMNYPNANSLHGLYRGRLGNAFCAPWNGGKDFRLSEIDSEKVPLHIINAALNVQASPTVNRRGRNADFFSFTSKFVGSDATGFAATSDYEKQETSLDFATAMAISGAAASSNMGAQSVKPLTFTLALLNVRLGVWLKNPIAIGGMQWTRVPIYFFKEIWGLLTEDQNKVYLTDGGHIENLGIYELLRRRCKLIVAVDAEADRGMNFGSFIALQRYARIDLGCRIEMKWDRLKKRALAVQQPVPAKTSSIDSKAESSEGLNGPHCALGKITYDGGATGYILYVKSSLSGDENDYILDYNRRNFDFPHETTADQFFSEEQFEVYRALGFHAVNGALSGEHDVETDAGLENLLDRAAKGSGLADIRERLGLKAKPPKPVPASSSQE
jgi:hypothetical protein